MTKGMHKKTSKRVPAKRRYKIEKMVKEHNKKLRKEMKKKDQKRKPKDPGIPNSLPFKEEILKDIQEQKKRAEEYREICKLQIKQQKLANQKIKDSNKGLSMADLAKKAAAEGAEFEAQQVAKTVNTKEDHIIFEKDTSNLKTFYKEFQKVVEGADIIVEVLDARDPLGSRCFEVEDIVLKNFTNKRLVLLLNKTDLVPRENLEKWLKYLRNELPTIPFKASTQNQRSNLSQSSANILTTNEDLLKSSKCLGADTLMKLLNNYCRNKDIKTQLTVGIVGFPNVGKSSVINSLKRASVCPVGPMPGLTKAMQSIALDKHIKLLDCPGVVFAKNHLNQGSQMSSILALKNAIKIENLDDPVLPIEALLNRVSRDDIMSFYKLTEFSTVREFLGQVAKRFGKMMKGGILDYPGAARKVLQDWNCGKIKYYTVPPERQTTQISAEIVTKMSDGFNIKEFQQLDSMEFGDETGSEGFQIRSLAEVVTEKAVPMGSVHIENADGPSTSKGPKRGQEDVEMVDDEMVGFAQNKDKKQAFKKLKKGRKRDAKLAGKLEGMDLEEDYNFAEDF